MSEPRLTIPAFLQPLSSLGPQGLPAFAADVCASDALGVHTDAQAAAVWIRAKASRTLNTFETYRREAVRLLLWLDETGLTLQTMTVDHVHRFFAHLGAPPRHWLRPRKPGQGVVLAPTQVLSGPLSAASLVHTRTVLGAMFAYLQDAGYVRFNVFKLAIKPAVTRSASPHRALTLASWFYLWQWVSAREAAYSERPEDRGKKTAVRARWLLALLYHAGLRREEVARGVMGDWLRSDTGWVLRVSGKGHKERRVAVNSILLGELKRYRRSWSLSELPHPGEAFPLVASVNAQARSRTMTPRAIGLIVQELAHASAQHCPDAHIRNQLTQLSTHWLRHTNATHRLAAGASLETTQDELGHVDPRTTRIYAQTLDSKRHDDAQKLANLHAAHGGFAGLV